MRHRPLQSHLPCPPRCHRANLPLPAEPRRTALAKPFVRWARGTWTRRAWDRLERLPGLPQFRRLRRPETEDPRCEVQRCECIREVRCSCSGSASHFLRRQVRRGGRRRGLRPGPRPEADLRRDLGTPTPEATARWAALATPASGLFLERVHYPVSQSACAPTRDPWP